MVSISNFNKKPPPAPLKKATGSSSMVTPALNLATPQQKLASSKGFNYTSQPKLSRGSNNTAMSKLSYSPGEFHISVKQ